MSTEDEIRKASDMFYLALNRTVNGDPRSMDDIWQHKSEISTMHPIGGRQVGWDEVRESWENIAKMSSQGQVKLSDQRICAGSDFSYELGTEHVHLWLAGNEIHENYRVTNIYRREGSEWKIVHHHVDLNVTMSEILSKLEASQER